MDTLREHIYNTIHRNKKPLKQIAEDVDMCVSYLNRCGLPDLDESDTGSGCNMPLKKLAQIIRSTGDYQILDHIEHLVGRVAVMLPAPSDAHPEIYRLTIGAVKEFGELMSQLGGSMADNRLTDEERKCIIHEGQEAVQAIVDLLHNLGAGGR